MDGSPCCPRSGDTQSLRCHWNIAFASKITTPLNVGTSHSKVVMFTYIHGCLGSLLGTKVLIPNHDLKLAYFVIPSYLHVDFEC